MTVVDEGGNTSTQKEERFTPGEFFWLDNVPAKNMIENNSLGPVKNWVNPSIIDEIIANPIHMDGNGAGSTRQHGRILLSAEDNFTNFCIKVKGLVAQLTNDEDTKLKVLIISGISGGTGSGIVVDATYIVQHAIRSHSEELYRSTSFDGFILLPPTGTSKNETDIKKGNRNGVAALKEIDHFMGIARRKECYKETFGTTVVSIDKPLFTICYLLDGSINGIHISNPRERSVEVLKNCILDMITSLPVTSDAKGVQDVASFMSDTPAFKTSLIGTKFTHVAPREANYTYCALGHGTMQIPLELMKAYVAKFVFDRMWELFKRCENVSEDDVNGFLKAAGAPDDGQLSGAFEGDPNQLKLAVNKAVHTGFMTDPNNPGKKGGPYYMVNLLNRAGAELARRSQTVGSYVIGARQKQTRMDQYAFINRLISTHRKNLFDVYVEVMEQLKEQLKSGSDILCDSRKMQDYYHSTYSFTPISFGTTDTASQLVKTYLDTLINGTRINEMCSDLIQEMFNNRAEWTQLTVDSQSGAVPKFAAADRFRQFWQSKINKIVSASLEDYLIKYYSKDPTAQWEDDPNNPGKGTPKAEAAIKIAATALVKEMWSKAGYAAPLVSLHPALNLDVDEFNGHKMFLIPKSAPHLIDAVKFEISQTDDKSKKDIKVAPSLVEDQISCYTQYTNIPAFMLQWAKKAEPHYEHSLSMHEKGMHMSETAGGNLWSNFPNLIPPVIWPKIDQVYVPSREIALREQASNLFDRALALGLPIKSNVGNTHYEFIHLPQSMIPDASLFKLLDFEKPDSRAWIDAKNNLEAAVAAKAQALFEKHNWEQDTEMLAKEDVASRINALLDQPMPKKSLLFLETVMQTHPNEDPEVVKDWDEYLAGALLRTSTEYTMLVRGTVVVLEALYEMIVKAQSIKKRISDFAHFHVANLFDYVAEEMTYYCVNIQGYQEEVFGVEFNNKIQEQYPEYFLYNKFLEKAVEMTESLQGQYDLVGPATAPSKAEAIARSRQLADKAAAELARISALLVYDRTKPTEGLMSKRFEQDCAGYHQNAEEIRDFYRKLQNALQYFTP